MTHLHFSNSISFLNSPLLNHHLHVDYQVKQWCSIRQVASYWMHYSISYQQLAKAPVVWHCSSNHTCHWMMYLMDLQPFWFDYYFKIGHLYYPSCLVTLFFRISSIWYYRCSMMLHRLSHLYSQHCFCQLFVTMSLKSCFIEDYEHKEVVLLIF